MNEPKKTETDEATAQEPEAKQEAAEADTPIGETEIEGVAGGGISNWSSRATTSGYGSNM